MNIRKNGLKRAAQVVAGACVVSAMLPAYAFAAEGGISAILPKMDEFVPMLVAFLILWAILAKFGWPIFDGMLKKREETIRESLEKSEEARVEAEHLLQEYREQLAQAKQEAATIIAEAKQSGDAFRAEATSRAQAEADDIVAKARQSIEAEKRAAVTELQASVADLTVAVTAKIVGENFSDEEHRQLIERSIAEVGNLNA